MQVVAFSLVCLCFASLASAIVLPSAHLDQFDQFVSKYNKHYDAGDYLYRRQVFLDNIKKIEAHNVQSSPLKLGVNEYADMTQEEFLSSMVSKSPINTHGNYSTFSDVSVAPPASVDWRTSTKPIVVGPVRSTGNCGSSAAIAILDSISSDYSISFKEDFYSFDTNYVTNCTSGGCGGLTDASVWAFVSKYGLQWYFNGCPTGPGVGMCITGITKVASGNEVALQTAVASKGPIVASIDASQASFQLYKSGIYYEPKCSSTSLDHDVLIVGYGSTNGQDYWIARNSWGTSWGQNGDVLLARNKNNNCGVATSATYATTVKNCVCEL